MSKESEEIEGPENFLTKVLGTLTSQTLTVESHPPVKNIFGSSFKHLKLNILFV